MPRASTRRLADLIPGAESRLFVTLVGQGRVQLATWFPRAPAASRDLPPQYASVMQLDAERAWGAAPIERPEGALLHLFRPDWRTPGTFIPDSSGVTSFAWHATRPGRLAWVAEPAGATATLWTGTARDLSGLERPEQVSTLPTGWQVRAWGDWGWLLAGPDGVRALSPDGVVQRERSGLLPVAVGPDGRSLLEDDDGGWTWADRTLDQLRPADFGPTVFAWRGDRMVVLEERTPDEVTFRMLEPETGGTVDRRTVPADLFPHEPFPLAWTFDDHLVAAAAYGSTVVFIDLDDGSVHRLSVDGSVWSFWVDERSTRP